MGKGLLLDFRLNTTELDGRIMRGGGLNGALQLDPADMRRAIVDAMQPGLAALKSNISGVKRKTGRLAMSPGIETRTYQHGRRTIVVGLVGYKSGVAPHARYLELGTPPRAGRGIVKPRRYAWKAFFYNRYSMQAAAQRNLEALVAKATASLR